MIDEKLRYSVCSGAALGDAEWAEVSELFSSSAPWGKERDVAAVDDRTDERLGFRNTVAEVFRALVTDQHKWIALLHVHELYHNPFHHAIAVT